MSTFGNQTAGDAWSSCLRGELILGKFPLLEDGTIDSLGARLQNLNAFDVAAVLTAYVDDAGEPGARVATASMTVAASDAGSDYSPSVDAPYDGAAGDYWLGVFLTSTGTGAIGCSKKTSGGTAWFEQNAGTTAAPDPAPAGTLTSSLLTVWAGYTPSAANPPSLEVAPALSGSGAVGSTLTVSTGTWLGSPTSYSYQWQRTSDGVTWTDITGETADTYTVDAADAGDQLRCAVTATNVNGSTTADSDTRTVTVPGQREWPVPPPSTTVHFLGDLHFGATSSVRTGKTLKDFSHPLAPTPLAHFQVGDLVNDGLSSQDTLALAWLADITDAAVYVACGNHDIWQNVRTIDAFEAAYASYLPGGSKNYTVDFPDLRVIVIGPDALNYPSDTTSVPISQATLDWLDARLAETASDCWIVCHAPLKDTVVSTDTTDFWSSDQPGIYVIGPNNTDDTEIRAVLGNHANAKAWISGHTHSPIDADGFAILTTCGTRQVAAINTASINWVGKTQEWNDRFCSVYLTRRASGAIDVRYRDHGAGSWEAPTTDRVTTLAPS